MADTETPVDELRFRLSTQCTVSVSFFGVEPTQVEIEKLIQVLEVAISSFEPASAPGAPPFEPHPI